MKTALVSGASGFVGRHLVPKLKSAGYEVTEIDIAHPENPCSLEHFVAAERARGRFSEWDLIVHLAAQILDVDARSKAGVGVYGDIALDLLMCKYVADNPPKECFVAMSSCATDYPEDCYGWIKLTLEKYCERLTKQGVPVVILRPFSGYSETQALTYPFPSVLKRAMEKQNPLVVWGGDQIRDWLHIDDLTNGIMHGIECFPRGVPVELGTGVGTNFYELAEMMADAVGYKPQVLGDKSKATASPKRVATSKLANECGWYPRIPLHEGIRRAVENSVHAEG